MKGLFYVSMTMYEWHLMRANNLTPQWFLIGGQVDTSTAEYTAQGPHPELLALYQLQVRFIIFIVPGFTGRVRIHIRAQTWCGVY